MSLEKIRDALLMHHNRSSNEGDIYIKDPEGNFIEMDMGAEYADSGICEDTIKALTDLNKYMERLESKGQEEKVARQLDHAGMDKLRKDNEQLRYWLKNCHEMLYPEPQLTL